MSQRFDMYNNAPAMRVLSGTSERKAALQCLDKRIQHQPNAIFTFDADGHIRKHARQLALDGNWHLRARDEGMPGDLLALCTEYCSSTSPALPSYWHSPETQVN